ncbi:MAG: UPF0489 family protein [Candidatus Margulisbacteria bacterium]|nr:UPF0489 family protein [Candidatus Margulisiibacteriota bacterium]MBU1021603.1 UPF0489 family protein [Candidatus Margulisiibacteriota bacterium]MBU1728754.1 UPF0489 family protein [Candidatus Margulisiibacteriota bacterium]MBU1955720.1 UPF0489 family protein [Candidatus Margulisiibacteriota bacterium]
MKTGALELAWRRWPTSLKKWKRQARSNVVPAAIINPSSISSGSSLLKYKRPNGLDSFDQTHYRLDQNLGRYRSKHVPKFYLGSLAELALGINPDFDVNSRHHSGPYFAGLELFPVIRKEGFSIYLVDGHRWAYWAWMEAITRGEIDASGLTLIHIDKHGDAEKPNGLKPALIKKLEVIPPFERRNNLICDKNGIIYGSQAIRHPGLLTGIISYSDEIFAIRDLHERFIRMHEESIKYFDRMYRLLADGKIGGWECAFVNLELRGVVQDPTFVWVAQMHGLFNELFYVSRDYFWNSSCYDFKEGSLGMSAESKRKELEALNIQTKLLSEWQPSPQPRRKTIIDIDCDAGSAQAIIAFLQRAQKAGLNPGVVTIALSPGEFANYSDTTDAPCFRPFTVEESRQLMDQAVDETTKTLIDLAPFHNMIGSAITERSSPIFPTSFLSNFPRHDNISARNNALITLTHFYNMVKIAEELITNW